MTVVFRLEAGGPVGFGHLSRALALAAWIAEPGAAVFWLGWPDADAERLVRAANHPLLVGGPFVPGRVPEASVVIHDLTHGGSLTRQRDIATELDAFGAGAVDRILIDGLGDLRLVTAPDFPIDGLVVPYAGGEHIDGARFRQWIGPAHAIFPPDLINRADRLRGLDRTGPDTRLLVTAGGSDPHGISLRVLDALPLVGRRMETRLVIGPGFQPATRSELTARAHGAGIDLVDGAAGLLDHLAWASIVVAATGLTKYELALTGIPSVQLSVDDAHARANEAFAALGSATHLGVVDRVTAADIALAIRRLVDDPPLRERQSNAGKKAISGEGAAQLLQAIGVAPRARQ